VPPDKWPLLEKLCSGEDVEATVIGQFESTGRLRLIYQGNQVADLDMHFLHDGRPPVVRQATWSVNYGMSSGDIAIDSRISPPQQPSDSEVLLRILSSLNVCSKEWIIRQYDHEVQGGTVIKPLVGVQNDGPGDASVIVPVLGEMAGLAIGCGLNPRYGDLEPYRMAAAAIDEAVRNVVAVGADPGRIAILDNFCWGNTDRPEVLGSLVSAAEACRDVALAYNMPFISGKDSLNNEFHAGDRHIVIPPTLLISAMGIVHDVRRCVTMDFKAPANLIFLIGVTKEEMGGSHYNLVTGQETGEIPAVDLQLAPVVFRKLHAAIEHGLIRSCHDLSEGGLAVAVAEMAFAGGIGADVTQLRPAGAKLSDEVALFSESNTRFVVEVTPANVQPLEALFGNDVPFLKIGQTCKEQRLRIAGENGEWLVWSKLADLKEAWQKPLRW
jgi:phosphoribosylformylglycinamidine (FGAM) synthase-like enzyme